MNVTQDLDRSRSAESHSALCTRTLLCLFLFLLTAAPSQSTADDAARGREILSKFVEVNRYWLVCPPETVRNFSYTLQRLGGTQEFKVSNPEKTPRSRLQGVTYAAMIHQLARHPENATVQSISEEAGGRVRLDLALEPPVRGACGNGVENSWNGYHSLGGNTGFLVLDSARWVPLEAGVGRLRETFGEFVTLDQRHFYPLAIRVKLDDTEYAWRFRVYEPGLWFFDDSHSGERRLAWVKDVKVNGGEAKLAFATTASLARAESEKAGGATLQAFLNVNRHWLLPSMETRRGLAYEYRQESPYLERVLIDPEGNVLVRLEASKDSPDHPTRQRLWLPDGRSFTGNAGDRFVRLAPAPGPAPLQGGFRHDRMSQHLAMGLALECALTRLAREPDTFWAQRRGVPGQPDKYLLVLHAQRDARLFTGTMLAFSSWSFMHDVRYDRSEILCDAATHCPLEEKDFSGESSLKGHYYFEEWHNGPSGSAPGRIRAVVPHEKDGKDQSLEMDARFRWVNNVWLLDQVESQFRGDAGGSTGKITVLSPTADSYAPLRELLQAAEVTQRILSAIETSKEEAAEVALTARDWSGAAVKAAWTDKARESARGEDEKGQSAPTIGLYRARVVQAANGPAVELEGISTASWKEFLTEWKVSLKDQAGATSWSGVTNLTVRAEDAPSAFTVSLQLPASAPSPERLLVQGTVRRMTAGYHGHGIWFRLMNED
jgi:hypothetical protein